MAVYMMFARSGAPSDLAGARVVREGFSKSAFVFGPLWFLRHRLWLCMLVWLVVAAGLVAASLVLSAPSRFIIALAFAFLTGLEANGLRARGLEWRGFVLRDIVCAESLQAAEARFFDRNAAEPAAPPAAGTPRPPLRPEASASVLGLFPEAERGR